MARKSGEKADAAKRQNPFVAISSTMASIYLVIRTFFLIFAKSRPGC